MLTTPPCDGQWRAPASAGRWKRRTFTACVNVDTDQAVIDAPITTSSLYVSSDMTYDAGYSSNGYTGSDFADLVIGGPVTVEYVLDVSNCDVDVTCSTNTNYFGGFVEVDSGILGFVGQSHIVGHVVADIDSLTNGSIGGIVLSGTNVFDSSFTIDGSNAIHRGRRFDIQRLGHRRGRAPLVRCR